MKRFVAVLSGLLVLPAFAEVAPIYYDEVIEYTDDVTEEPVVEEQASVVMPVAQPSRANSRAASGGRVSATRVVPQTASSRNVVRSSRDKTVQARTATATPAVSSRATATRAARSATNGAGQISATRRQMQTSQPNVAARASIIQTDTVNTPLYTGRVSTRASAMRARIPTISANTSTASNTAVTTSSTSTVEEVAKSMDELAQITDFCKAQYTDCMDNFCNVLDDNQGRCSCSKNIKNYEKTEVALKEATEALQDVAQQIQYIGLAADDIETLFTQTEAELQMNASSDNSQLKNDLDKIKNMIVDIKTGTASSTETGLSFDLTGLLDFNIDSTGFDLSALFGGGQTNTASISNQRGEQLYKTAAARCKAAVLTECQAQGVDISVITNSYDMEIDKQCIAYERNLTDANEEMSRTVRNAKNVLQRARLMVAQEKNAYDLRGCVNALDSCMQDDFVCGTDYELCLDPTGKYIVNGEIVVGSTPGYAFEEESVNVSAPSKPYSTDTLYGTWEYGDKLTAWGATNEEGTLHGYVDANLKGVVPSLSEADTNMAKYLQYKIGYNEDGHNYGMCMGVLNKCQDITYDGDKYIPENNVIREYLHRTLVQIKSAQDALLADYAENCVTDVQSCLSSNSYDLKSTSKSNIAINACKSQIMTCMSVTGNSVATPSPAAMQNWAGTLFGCEENSNMYYNSVSGKCAMCEGDWDFEKSSCTCPDGTSAENGKCPTEDEENQ